MSSTPDRGAGAGDPGDDIHQTIKASRQIQPSSEAAQQQEQQEQQTGDISSPLSFKKRRESAAPSSSDQANKRSSSFSNLFKSRQSAPTHLSMPQQSSHMDSLSAPGTAQSTPTRRMVSSKGISPGASTGTGSGNPVSNAQRRVSQVPSTRGIHQTLGTGSSSGAGLGQRISDWQQQNARSPMEAPPSPGLAPDDGADDDDTSLIDAGGDEEPPPDPILPQMLPGLKTPESQTPLPKIATIVLAISMVGEFLSASVGAPFLLPMLEDLGVPGGGGESAVGLWAGIVSAAFFLTQFATALLWASASVRFGRRAVLFTSLLGNTVMLLMYGTTKSVVLMVVIRLFQGAFNGAVGVARSAIKDITDPTNEGRAYSVLGLCWSLGGIIGPILGGWLEHPVEHIPSLFSDSVLFAKYPYLLPTSVAASVTFTGCVLTLFLSYDGGPREGAIRLPEEKDVERAVNAAVSLPGSVKKKLSGYFGQSPTHPTRGEVASPLEISERGSALHTGKRAPSMAFSKNRTSFALPHRGSAYGYDAMSRRRSTAISRSRRMSAATSTRYAPDYEGEETDLPPLNFAQKLLFANNEAGTFNISDVWIAAATRDEGDPYTSAGLEEDPFADDDESALVDESILENDNDGDEDAEELADGDIRDPFTEGNQSTTAGSRIGAGSRLQRLRHDSVATGTSGQVRQSSPLRQASAAGGGAASLTPGGGQGRLRSHSIMSSASRPALYQNTGLARSPMTSPVAMRKESASYQYFDQQPQSSPAPGSAPATAGAGLAAIPEGKPSGAAGGGGAGGLLTVPGQGSQSDATIRELSPAAELTEKDPLQDFSIMRDLPVTLIAQYTLLALHGTIMDQVFMSFLVSKSYAGGLGLQASDFADIIACMCFFQMIFQFRFYPSVSLPLGRLTHLQMFRLGLCLYLIPYIFIPELRPLLSVDGTTNRTVTFGLILLTATRYLANTCAYTAVMILINAMTPPAYIPLANGLAQSAVSLARFIGPLSGGIIWSNSIKDGPEGYYIGFVVCASVCALGLMHSFFLR